MRDRIKLRKAKDFWVRAIAFVGKHENLSKAHCRSLEGRLIEDATEAGPASSRTRSRAAPGFSDREDMEFFWARSTASDRSKRRSSSPNRGSFSGKRRRHGRRRVESSSSHQRTNRFENTASRLH